MAKRACAFLLTALLITPAGCGLFLATPGSEARVGEIAAKDVEAQMGLVETPGLTAYVSRVGKRLAAEQGVRSNVTYSFKIVDMVEPNAFALPGGHIYISRGLLVLLDDEDEMANVIAHEVAHVSARHHLKHAMLSTPFVPVRLAAGIAGAATRIAAAPLGRLGAPIRAGGAVVEGIGGATGSLSLAKHSRSQENEADEIGQTLAAAGGWNPEGMTRVMNELSAYVRLQGGDPEKQSFLDSHPSSPERALSTEKRARQLRSSDVPPIAPDAAAFLAHLEGLLVGPSAREGAIWENQFLHPDLNFRIAFPKDWTIKNGASNVTASPEDDQEGEEVFLSLALAGEGDDPVAIAKQVLDGSGLHMTGEVRSETINGLPAARADGIDEHARTAYHVQLHWIAHQGLVYQVLAAVPKTSWSRYAEAALASARSFRTLQDGDRAHIREKRLHIVKARGADDLEALLSRYDTPWTPEIAGIANSIEPVAKLAAGRSIKVAVWKVYTPPPESDEESKE